MPLTTLDVTVPLDAIERVLRALPGPERAQEELLRFARAQNELMTFVRTAAEPLGEDGVGQAVYLAYIAWSAFEQAFPGEVKPVAADELKDACDAAEQAMKEASEEEDKQRRPLERLHRAAPPPRAPISTPAAAAPLPRPPDALPFAAFARAADVAWPVAGGGALAQAVPAPDDPGEFFRHQPHLHALLANSAQGDLFLLGSGIVEAFHRSMLTRAVEEMVRRADKTVRRTEPRIGRNDPCPCGSGKKYKFCHGA
jgi:hypothetical protein